MAYACPRCGRQYDATLFEFGRAVRCVCGRELDIREGHRRYVGPSPESVAPPDATPPDPPEASRQEKPR